MLLTPWAQLVVVVDLAARQRERFNVVRRHVLPDLSDKLDRKRDGRHAERRFLEIEFMGGDDRQVRRLLPKIKVMMEKCVLVVDVQELTYRRLSQTECQGTCIIAEGVEGVRHRDSAPPCLSVPA